MGIRPLGTSIKEDPLYNSQNPGGHYINAENQGRIDLEIHNSVECRSKVNFPVNSRSSKTFRGYHSVEKVTRAKPVNAKVSSNSIVDWHSPQEHTICKSFVENSVEVERSETKHAQFCRTIQEKDEYNRLLTEASSNLPSSPFTHPEEIHNFFGRSKEFQISNTVTNHLNTKENYELFEANEGHKAASQTRVRENPCCNLLNEEIQHTDPKYLLRTQIEIHNSEECRPEVDLPLDFKFSSNWAVDWPSQEKCGIPMASVHNSVGGESSEEKHHEIHPAIQHNDGNNQAIIMNSSQLPSNRFSFVEAITRSIENSEKLKSGKNKGKQRSATTFSCVSIMNETCVLRMEETVPFTKISSKQTMDGGNKLDLFLKEEEVEVEDEEEQEEEDNGDLEEKQFEIHQMDQQKQQGQQQIGFGPLDCSFEDWFPKKSLHNTINKRNHQNRRVLSLIIFWKKKRKTREVEAIIENYQSLTLKRYRYLELKKMTNSFEDKLGQGSFGHVFKGKLPDGRAVAVKVMSERQGNGVAFLNEVTSISRTDHVNIVSLLGLCFEGSKRALIYEFMPNGSLDKFIKPRTSQPLGWETLYQIALGVARGLSYLHRGCSTRIIHFDIKPHNILLDQDFFPKISDFGLAKICPTTENINPICIRGTAGYMAPEFICQNFGGVSYKSDVYSYGMMVLEMVGGRKNCDATVDNAGEIYFPHWIYDRIDRQGDIGLGEFPTEAEDETARKMILVGLWCIQLDLAKRPSMGDVVKMLEGSIEDLQVPPRPFPST
ncbi:uncharacterized protein LOC143853216 [Tasmannia lanceolata]|uniref:uncharacterized protein LOC143853216 n=1 Tax=Tasmannia lanceolata TaxID=3420 RepID=UPI004062F2CF